MFSVTAAGSLGDGVLFNDSSDDDTWDAVWDAAVSIDDKGWIAEMRIPFSQLRFSAADRQVWGLHVVRVRPAQERGDLVGARAEERQRRRLAGGRTGRPRRHPRAGGTSSCCPTSPRAARSAGRRSRAIRSTTGEPARPRVGLDLKWGFTSNMTMDATVNPDFGQVEVDPAVVNLTAFETFFEEKRPFFIEGSQAFDQFGRNGASGYMGFNRTNPTLFYSRRIGRAPQGAAAGRVRRPAVGDDDPRRGEGDGQDEPRLDGELHRRGHGAGVGRHGHRRRARARPRSSRSPTTWRRACAATSASAPGSAC